MFLRIFYIICVLLCGTGLTYLLFSLSGTKAVVDLSDTGALSIASLSGGELSLQQIETGSAFRPGNYTFQTIDRLAFVFSRPQKIPKRIVVGSGGQIPIGDESYVFGLYDPFISYQLVHKDYTLEQITNGSFFVTKEDDGTITVYSLDGVARFYFLSEGQKMTDMILFPGNYLRFDPKINASLKNKETGQSADLLAITNRLDGSSQVFEYINPRVTGDQFHNYRSRKSDNELIQLMHTLLVSKVDTISSLIEKYQKMDQFPDLDKNISFMNPGKKNYYLLLSLSSELAKSLSTQDASGSLDRISEIYKEGNKKNLKGPVENTLRQFIIDGRFAVYQGISGGGFDALYGHIAELIGIVPKTRKNKTLQDLSNIYAKNIVSSLSRQRLSLRDVNVATANILEDALKSNGELSAKDFFDLATYSYNILKKQENAGQLSSDAVQSESTFLLLDTFFEASRLYIDSLDDFEKRSNAKKVFAVVFYQPVFHSLASALRDTYMTSQGGQWYLRPEFRGGNGLAQVSETIIQGADTLMQHGDRILEDVEGNGGSDEAKNSLSGSISVLKLFVSMTRDYKEYLKQQVDSLTSSQLVGSVGITPSGVGGEGSGSMSGDSSPINSLSHIFPELPSTIRPISGLYIIVRTPVSVQSSQGKSYPLLISAKYNPATQVFSSVQIESVGSIMKVNPTNISYSLLARYLPMTGDYVAKVEEIRQQEGELKKDITISYPDRSLMIGGQVVRLP